MLGGRRRAMKIGRRHSWQIKWQINPILDHPHIDAFARGIDQPVEINDVAKLERIEIGLVRRRVQTDFAWSAGRSHSTVSRR